MDEGEDSEERDAEPCGGAEGGYAHVRTGGLVADGCCCAVIYHSGGGVFTLLEDLHEANLDGGEVDGTRANDV